MYRLNKNAAAKRGAPLHRFNTPNVSVKLKFDENTGTMVIRFNTPNVSVKYIWGYDIEGEDACFNTPNVSVKCYYTRRRLCYCL